MYRLKCLVGITLLCASSAAIGIRREVQDSKISLLERAEQAVIQNDVDRLRSILLQGVWINSLPASGVPLLFRAASDRHWDLVDELIRRGALFEIMDFKGWFTVMDYLAGLTGDHTAGLEFFLKRGASIRGPNSIQRALILDRVRGRFLAQGKDLDVQNYPTPHPLVSAVRAQNSVHVRWLLKKGADPNLEDFRGYPIQIAIENGDLSTLNELLTANVSLWLPIPDGGFSLWLKRLWKIENRADWQTLPETQSSILQRLKAHGFQEPV